MEKLLLIDGNSIIYRAYFALPPLTAEDGLNVNAVYGFMNIFNRAVNDYEPTHIAVAFDMKGENFRKKLYEGYKANRKPMPDDLVKQMPVLEELLKSLGIRTVKSPGVEADDIIGTLTRRFGKRTYILSGDRDLLQLVDKDVTVLLTKKGVTEVEENDEESMLKRYGYKPEQVTDFKALCGDASDNIPGVRGIGEKSAVKLLEEYGNIENIYEHTEEIKGALKNKLLEDKENCFLSKRLACIVTDADIECKPEECGLVRPYPPEAYEQLRKLRFNSIIKRMEFREEKKPVGLDEIKEVLLTDPESLAEAIEKVKSAPVVSLYIGDGISFASEASLQYRAELSDNFTEGQSYNECIMKIGELAECQAEKTVLDGKRLRHFFAPYGIALNNVRYDISIMDYLVSYRGGTNDDGIFVRYNVKKGAAGLLVLKERLTEELKSTDTLSLYEEMELPLSEVLYEMEREGVKIDVGVLEELGRKYNEETEALTEKVYELCGCRFNLQSPKQLSEVLFEKLGLTPPGKKTKSGYSTGADVMEKLAQSHPVIPLIMRIRMLSKLYGTYIEGFRQHIGNDGIVHTTFNQTLTATGRLSSSDPNMQNLPVRSEEGRELRKMFVAKRDVLVGADYSQIELRLLAEFSGDENLIRAFNEGRDIHATVASELFNVPSELVTPNMRRTAKAVNFGIIYGISSFGLGNNVGISTYKAGNYIRKYYEKYPTIKKYLEGLAEKAKKDGYMTTIANRRRLLPEIHSSNYQTRSFAERAAMNMPLQGSAADIMKIAMIRVRNAMQKEGLKSRIVLQIHDELIVDAFAEEAERIKEILVEEMENVFDTKVRLTVNVEEGTNLYEAK